MPTIVTDRPYRAVDAEPRRKKWTRAECDAFDATGLWDQDHLELIGGELITKMPKYRPHTNALVVLIAWAFRTFGDEFVNPEVPIDVSPEDTPTNRPEPDMIVLSTPSKTITDRCPRPNELRLVVEVADSSIGFDLTIKADLYARALIVEYWVVDIQARKLVVHRNPQAGQYQSVATYAENETVTPLASPTTEFAISQLFPN